MKLLESIRHGSFASRRVVAFASVSMLAGCSAGEASDAGEDPGSGAPSTSAPPGDMGVQPPISSPTARGGSTAAPGRVDEGTPSLPLGGASGGAGPVAAGGGSGLGSGGNNSVPGAGGAASTPPSRTGCLNPGSGDYASAGPYRVATEVVDLGEGIAPNQATGEFTIFYPEPFEADCPHPIVAWGNGTGVTGPAVYEFFNRNAASWGIVVIAAHDSNTGSGNYHRAGIDYLLEQNAASGSEFFGKLSDRAGVTGHSQGGFGASQAASHPNVRALVPVGASGRPLATTAFLCLTGTEDIAPDSCRTAVQGAPGPAMAAIWEGGDHVVTETVAGFLARDPGTIQMMRLYAAWFRCYLADDAVACGLFEGESCGICSDSGWAELVTNNL